MERNQLRENFEVKSEEERDERIKEALSIERERLFLETYRSSDLIYAKTEETLTRKFENIQSIIYNLPKMKNIYQDKIMINQLEEELKNGSLINVWGEEEYKFKPTKLIDIKKMVNEIEEWFKNLTCNSRSCRNQAINEF